LLKYELRVPFDNREYLKLQPRQRLRSLDCGQRMLLKSERGRRPSGLWTLYRLELSF
jgi:hypothetical protein